MSLDALNFVHRVTVQTPGHAVNPVNRINHCQASASHAELADEGDPVHGWPNI